MELNKEYKKQGAIQIKFGPVGTVGILGFFLGLGTGISIKTGHSIDETGVLIEILKGVCKVTENGAGMVNCNFLIPFLIGLSILVAIGTVYYHTTKVKDYNVYKWKIKGWKIGLITYIITFVIGLVIALMSLS